MSNAYTVLGGNARKIQKIYDVDSGVTRKIGKGYSVVGGVTKQFFAAKSGITAGYTGAYTTSDITVDGVNYTLWTLTGSGTLTISDAVQYWMCGGGGNGKESYVSSGVVSSYCSGGGGGGGYTADGTLEAGTHSVSIGAAKGASKIGSITAAAGSTPLRSNGGSGGSGGGSGVAGGAVLDGGSGDGKSKYPFNITALYAHCAGGGAGARLARTTGYDSYIGGAGGSNGENGGEYVTIKSTTVSGGAGGNRGGGAGGMVANRTSEPGSSATFYGSGGGGGAIVESNSSSTASGGSGYQGVVYILVPKSA